MLARSERLADSSADPISDDGWADTLGNADAQAGPVETIRRNVDDEQVIRGGGLVRHQSVEVGAAQHTLAFSKSRVRSVPGFLGLRIHGEDSMPQFR